MFPGNFFPISAYFDSLNIYNILILEPFQEFLVRQVQAIFIRDNTSGSVHRSMGSDAHRVVTYSGYFGQFGTLFCVFDFQKEVTASQFAYFITISYLVRSPLQETMTDVSLKFLLFHNA